MSSQYQKCYAKNGIFAYARNGAPRHHLFIFASAANPPDTYASLAPMLAAWSGASGRPAQRSILFCQLFDPATITTALDLLVTSGAVGQCWGKLVYWRDKSFSGGPFNARFPDSSPGSRTLLKVGEVSLRLETGTIPTSLDNFTISASASEDLTLKLAASGAKWSVDGVNTPSVELVVSLDPGSKFTAGSIGMNIPWNLTTAGTHPYQRTRVAYVAEPTALPAPGDDPVTCEAWQSGIIHEVKGAASAVCGVHLDPRDGVNTPGWLDAGGLNSRLIFGDADLHSTFFGAAGDRFLMKATDNAVARIGFLRDMIDGSKDMHPSGAMVFHPEGRFELKSAAPSPAPFALASDLNISRRDFVAGGATSEFLNLGAASDVTHIEFVSGPAFLPNEAALPSNAREFLAHGKDGSVVTSHVKFMKEGNPTAVAVELHSQSSEAPLFEAAVATPEHLRRRRQRYGLAKDALPVFPHAGHTSGDYDRLQRHETTHLAPYRRKNSPPPPSPLTAFDAAPTFAVTPQGILARVGPDGNYQQLYFGNPDSKTERPDFVLNINNAAAQLYLDVQQGLKASQLFAVLRNPSPDALKVVTPSLTLNARDFEFAIHDGAASASSLKAAAFLVKYYKGQSIEDLLKDPAVWLCAHDLAPKGNSDLDKWTPFPKGQPVPPHLKRLHDVWTDENWQGVLVLDFPLDDEPGLIKALRPGLAKKPGATKVELKAPYFGLNALQATAADLKADPKRPGSVFGMIRYDKTEVGTEPDVPTKDDVEPGATHDPDRQYRFIVDSLQIVFENSQIADFKAKLFIKFDHLFWDGLDGLGADGLYSLELDGHYERRGTEDVFSLISPNKFVIKFPDASYLKQLTITRAQLGVVSSDNDQLTAFIGIDGELQLSEKIANLPIFSVKLIRLSSFGFEYSFKKGDNPDFKFRFKPSGMSVDIDFNLSGLKGLLSFLPVKLKGMSIALGQVLDLNDLHFAPINFGGLGTKFHFGFLMELDFGSFGNLAGDLRGMKFPMLLGWGGGSSKGLAFGIQFPSREGKGIDIGIQQFIRLQAEKLNLVPCYDGSHNLLTFAIQAVKARIVMLGHKWPDADTSFAFFVPIASGRKPSWAFGVKNDPWYVGGGYRLKLPTASAKEPKDIKGVVKNFEDTLNDVGSSDNQICSLASQASASSDNWSIVGRYSGELNVQLAISDPTLYGIAIEIPALGELDVMYRRVNSQLGIFSIEYALPGPLRQFQIGVATVRLPVFRIEIHTDGGFLFDFGFPWNNDFSRSCQVEIAIFLGSGGFYYGITSAAAADLLQFEGGYGYSPPDSTKLNELRTLRLGFAARVGIGRSFTIGILEAEASVTIFGGVEGAIAYRPGNDLFHPTLYAVKGYVGLMVDIRATVNFAIIRASAHILAYVEVGFEIRRVLAKNPAGQHRIVDLPIIIFAEIGLTVTVEVGIHIGCVDITIHLSFNATWRYEEALTQFKDQGPYDVFSPSFDALLTAEAAFTWNPAYRYWPATRDLTIFATVLPCMARASDVEQMGSPKTCAVGTLLLPALGPDHGLADLARFLLGWVLLPATIGPDPAAADAYQLTLGQVNGIVDQMRDPKTTFWDGFPAVALDVTTKQFAAQLTELTSGSTESFATIPLWPGVTFKYVPVGGTPAPTEGTSAVVSAHGASMSATDAAFSDFCRHLIAGTIPEIQQLIRDDGYFLHADGTVEPNASLPAQDPRKSLKWSELWQKMLAPL
ncbi:hypothetical protein [Bradyrhizobium sp. HKCCYLS2033]|uniref:hypothetical protein n=1 Tax=unclassified Bradyrhizobium TaxID=2631580 RepID=UPI003EBD6754